MFVRESIEDVLIPKTQEEINQALDKWSLEEKMEMIENNIDADRLFSFIIQGGGNRYDIVETLLEQATEKELKEIILEMVDDDEDVETIFYFITGGDGRIEEEKIKRAYKQFIDSTNQDELAEVLDNMIMQNPELISRPTNRGWNFGG